MVFMLAGYVDAAGARHRGRRDDRRQDDPQSRTGQAGDRGWRRLHIHGPVYATPTKPGRQPVGLAYVREAAGYLDIPAVAIGGIDLSNIDDVLAAGAKTIGVVRACSDAVELLKRIKKAVK